MPNSLSDMFHSLDDVDMDAFIDDMMRVMIMMIIVVIVHVLVLVMIPLIGSSPTTSMCNSLRQQFFSLYSLTQTMSMFSRFFQSIFTNCDNYVNSTACDSVHVDAISGCVISSV